MKLIDRMAAEWWWLIAFYSVLVSSFRFSLQRIFLHGLLVMISFTSSIGDDPMCFVLSIYFGFYAFYTFTPVIGLQL